MKHNAQPTSLLNATLQLTAVSLISQLLYFIYQVALTHMIGTEVLGLMHMVMPIYYTLLSFLSSGFALAISKLCSEYQSKRLPAALEHIVSNTLHLFLLSLLLVVLFFWLSYRTFANQVLSNLPLGNYVLILPPLLFFTALEIFNKHYFYGINVVQIPAIIQITEQLVRISAVLLLLFIFPQQTPAQSLLLILIGMLISEVYSSLHLTFLRRKQPLSFSLSKDQCAPLHMSRSTAKIALPISLATLFCQSISSINTVLIPNLMIRAGLTQQDALQQYGVFSGMTLPLITMPLALLSALSTVLLPYLTRRYTLGEHLQARNTLRTVMLIVILIIAPATALISCFGEPLAGLFYRHPEAGRNLWPLAVGVTFSALEGIMETALTAFNRQVGNAIITLVSSLIQLYFTLAYTSSVGLDAFVYGFLIATLWGSAARTFLLHRALRIIPRKATVSVLQTTPGTGTGKHTPDPLL